jgi:hypothetical protein
MKRLIVNIILFFVAVILLSTIGVFGLFYAAVWTARHFTKVSFLKYWGDLLYAINFGIDCIGNVLLSTFLNNFAIVDKTIYPFGRITNSISHALAVNHVKYQNTTKFGLWIINILEKIDKGHMQKSLKQHS